MKRRAKTPKKKTGRPLADLNPRAVARLAEIGCTNVEIASVFTVDESVVRKRFPEILTKGRTRMKERLRRAQLKAALKGNVTMQIWLGKQVLQQVDHSQIHLANLDKMTDEELAIVAAGRTPA